LLTRRRYDDIEAVYEAPDSRRSDSNKPAEPRVQRYSRGSRPKTSDYTFFAKDGGVRRASGELKFGWIIDGRAVLDIWITYPKEASKERSIGT
jgi:hypothetical protein